MNLFILALVPGSSRRWAQLMLGVLALLLAGTWWMASSSEGRAMQQTLQQLDAGLSARAPLPAAGWVNPFLLLDAPPENYCGEASAERPLQRGCWYFLPGAGQVLYRSRFGSELGGGQIHAWSLVVRPAQVPGHPSALELHATRELLY